MPLNLEQLPHRRNEAWKWTDLRGSVKEKIGLSDSLTPDINMAKDLPLNVKGNAPHEAAMSTVAAAHNPEVISIEVPAGVILAEPINIFELTKGHARIDINLGEGASAQIVEHHRGRAGVSLMWI